MLKIPFTRNEISFEIANDICDAVRAAQSMPTENVVSRLATVDDAKALYSFLSDPNVSAPIYTLPRPLTVESVARFVTDHVAEQEQGEGLLFLNFNKAGQIGGYIDICLWPQWAAGELGGAVHPDRQGERRGIEGARLSFEWMFETLGLDLICETASLDNDRTARLLDGLGFKRMGRTESKQSDGSLRASLVWEISKQEWRDIHST